MLAMPWIATGVFVYQSFITEAKEWGSFIIAQSFMVYSILSVLTLLGSGFLIEQIALVSFIYIATATVLLFFVRNKLNPHYL